MNEQSQTLFAIIQQLRDLFKDKDRLVGVDDWDCFIGCLIALQNVAESLPQEEEKTAEE